MFDSLSAKFQDTIAKIRGQDKITEANVEGALSEIRRELLEADVSLKAVKLFTSRVKEKALDEKVLRGVKPGEQFTKILFEALTERLGGSEGNPSSKISINDKLDLKNKPTNILLLGLQGAGKTTAAAKLGLKLKNSGLKVLLVPCDLQRPAAVTQLSVLANKAGIDFLEIRDIGGEYQVKTPLELTKLAEEYAKTHAIDVLIFDTAGRLQVDTDLMAELLLLEKQVKPSEKLLVIDSLIGQESANVADTFNTQIGISGIILSKLDSDTRGGAALSVVEATDRPIKFASVGEKLEDLEVFYPDRIASRILGMGDVLSLVERAEEQIAEEESKRLEAELMKGNFNYETFLSFQNMISKLGDFGSIFKMLGMGQMFSQFGLNPNDQNSVLNQGQAKMSKFKIAINSMSKEERKRPELLSSHATAKSRKSRIAKGSGQELSDIEQLCAEFSKMSKMFKNLGPLLAGMGDQATANKASINPAQIMQQMSGGFSRKQQKAMRQSGMMGSPKLEIKQTPKGARPQIKGFRD